MKTIPDDDNAVMQTPMIHPKEAIVLTLKPLASDRPITQRLQALRESFAQQKFECVKVLRSVNCDDTTLLPAEDVDDCDFVALSPSQAAEARQ